MPQLNEHTVIYFEMLGNITVDKGLRLSPFTELKKNISFHKSRPSGYRVVQESVAT